ncbi:MAG: T9SS type A sorting domain-containing protein, partial [Saprospiraceae bacterium]
TNQMKKNKSDQSYELIDVLGKKIRGDKLNLNNPISLDNVIPGIFFLNIIDKGNRKIKTQKILIE